jgi:hypothetical protein
MSVPSMKTLPSSGFSSPMSVFRSTDLPVPEGPSITEISPAGNVRVTSFQMTWLPKLFERPSMTTSVPTEALPADHGTDRPGRTP